MRLCDLQNHWALVTGASSGIGAEFARQLAARKINLVLVARRQERLLPLAGILEKSYKIQTLVLPLDLTQEDAPLILKAALEEQGIKIRALVNNAAFGKWGPFEKYDPETYEKMIRLNATLPVILCRIFLDDLLSFPTSVLIHVASAAMYQPVPFMGVYAATKSFIGSLSQALFGEFEDRGLLVQTLVPGPTTTEFEQVAEAYPCNLKAQYHAPQEVVEKSIRGLEKGRAVVVTARGAWIQRAFGLLAPPAFAIRKVREMFRPPTNCSKDFDQKENQNKWETNIHRPIVQ